MSKPAVVLAFFVLTPEIVHAGSADYFITNLVSREAGCVLVAEFPDIFSHTAMLPRQGR
ncbi:hypothetical protein [Vibrio sp. B1FLJ16]|uniref:hypothetical protein n=1 Tax=Vibrio sp. B1FLJ16 TaxID=2751178 RepID=UPI001FD5BDDA|nr:hypothetical protein [Vibrio sp. B1FLJ16]